MRFLISFALLLVLPLASFAAETKSLTAIVPKGGLSSSEYKALENFSTKLGREIKNSWFPASYGGNLRSVVRIPLNKVTAYELRESSGNSNFDQTCLMAIDRCEALINYPSDKYIEYLFEYKQHNLKVPSGRFFRWPAQLGIGYLSKKMGMSPYVQIPIY